MSLKSKHVAENHTVKEVRMWPTKLGVRGGVVVKAPRYKPVGRGFDSPMVSLEIFIDIILPAAL